MRVRVRVRGQHRAQEKNRDSRVRLDERPEISVRTGTQGWVRAHEELSGGLGSINGNTGRRQGSIKEQGL